MQYQLIIVFSKSLVKKFTAFSDFSFQSERSFLCANKALANHVFSFVKIFNISIHKFFYKMNEFSSKMSFVGLHGEKNSNGTYPKFALEMLCILSIYLHLALLPFLQTFCHKMNRTNQFFVKNLII